MRPKVRDFLTHAEEVVGNHQGTTDNPAIGAANGTRSGHK